MTNSSIPASAIVNVFPSVIDAGGTGLDLVGLVLTNSTRVPIDTVATFTSAAAVAIYFGPTSPEAGLATKYFLGFDNSQLKPAKIHFVQYPDVAVPAFLRGSNISNLSVADIQALSGTLTLTIDGNLVTSAAIDLAAATSLSEVAVDIQTALAHFDAVVTGAIAATELTVTAVTSGTLAIGQVIQGTGVTAGTTITAFGTGTGGIGTYTVSESQTVSSTAISAGEALVAYDAVAGALVITAGTPGVGGTITVADDDPFSTALGLTAAVGAVVSPGAAAGEPDAVMTAVTAQTQDFASFMTVFKPTVADMVAFATWTSGTFNRFLYVMWDNDVTSTTSANTASAGYAIETAGLSGTAMIYDPTDGIGKAAFVMGAIASIDFNQIEGRTNLSFRKQAGLLAGVTNETIAAQLITNGFNFYGSYATAADGFVFLYPGAVTGDFAWIDSYINQIWMNNSFQLALMDLLTSIRSIPYNDVGYALIETALADTINLAVSFGAIRGGVPLSAAQAADVNGTAGIIIDRVLEQRGWFLQVAPASAEVRAARGSPPVTFWYTDGQSVQKITLNSVQVQ